MFCTLSNIRLIIQKENLNLINPFNYYYFETY